MNSVILFIDLFWILSFRIYFFKDHLLFLDRGEGREKERERNVSVWLPLMCPPLGTWPVTQARALPGNRTGDPLVCRPELNPVSHTSQGQNLFFFPYLFIYLLRERGREEEREGEKHQCVVASHVPLAGELAHNPGMCPDWESNCDPLFTGLCSIH